MVPQRLDTDHGSDSPSDIWSGGERAEETRVETELGGSAPPTTVSRTDTGPENGIVPDGSARAAEAAAGDEGPSKASSKSGETGDNEGGERRDLSYILFRACRAIGLDASYPALESNNANEDPGDAGDDQGGIFVRRANKRPASFGVGARRSKRPAPTPAERTRKVASTKRKGGGSSQHSTGEKPDSAAPSTSLMGKRSSGIHANSSVGEGGLMSAIDGLTGAQADGPRRSGRARQSTEQRREA